MNVRHLVLATGILSTAWAAPSSLSTVDFRSTLHGIVIVTAKHSPAYAALEDARMQFSNENSLATSFARLDQVEQLSLKARRVIPTVREALQDLAVQAPVADKNGETATTIMGGPSATTSRQDHLAQLVEHMNSELQPATAVEYAEVLVKEELSRRERESDLTPTSMNVGVRTLATEAGSSIVVAKGGVSLASYLTAAAPPVVSTPVITTPPPAAPPSNPETSRTTSSPFRGNDLLASNNSKSSARRTSGERSIYVPDVPAPTPSPVSDVLMKGVATSQPKRYVVGGPVTFAGGMAFLGGSQQITVRQVVDDLTIAEGYVNIRDAVYGVDVEGLEGEILIEVRDAQGQVLGQGRTNLYEISHLSQNIANIKNLAVQIRPVFSGVSGTAISAASYGKAKYIVADAKLFIDGLEREIVKNKKSGQYEDETLSPPSTFLVRTQHRSFWPSVAMVSSGEPFQLRLFPAGLVEALLDLALPKAILREAREQGVIWGRVTYAGHPVEGAQVHMIGDRRDKPIYFTGYLPDKTKSATTTRGEFAFVGLTEPENILRVSLNGKLYWPTLHPVAQKHVSYADLEIEASRTVEFKSYDAFSLKALATVFRPLGAADEMQIPETGTTRMKVDTVRGLTLLEADAGEPYQTLRVAVRPGQTEIHLPQVRTEWLTKLHAGLKANGAAFTTAVVGFVDGDDFEVMLGAGDNLPAQNLVYFDQEGMPLRSSVKKDSSHGVAGGGFIIYDLPRGLHTLTVMPDRAKKVVTQAVYVDEYATHLARFNLAF